MLTIVYEGEHIEPIILRSSKNSHVAIIDQATFQNSAQKRAIYVIDQVKHLGQLYELEVGSFVYLPRKLRDQVSSASFEHLIFMDLLEEPPLLKRSFGIIGSIKSKRSFLCALLETYEVSLDLEGTSWRVEELRGHLSKDRALEPLVRQNQANAFFHLTLDQPPKGPTLYFWDGSQRQIDEWKERCEPRSMDVIVQTKGKRVQAQEYARLFEARYIGYQKLRGFARQLRKNWIDKYQKACMYWKEKQ